MEDLIPPYLRCEAQVTFTPTPRPGGAVPVAYPAREVAAAIIRLRGVRGASRRNLALHEAVAWNTRLWRWWEDGRQITLGMRVHLDGDGVAMWAETPLDVDARYDDVARLASALGWRFPALGMRLMDGRVLTVRAFLTEVAMARLAPALASERAATREQALAAQAIYAALLDDAPRPATAEALAAGVSLDILYEDEALLAVNKPTGLVIHPTYKHPDGTLTDAVFAHEEALGRPRPWLLHRLDKETSGVALFARADAARRSLVAQFERHTAHKRYLALALWPPESGDVAEGEVDAPLARDPLDRRRVIVVADGQPSRTRYRRLAASRVGEVGYALILAEPVTGRTHQIRAHLAAIGAPLVGDTAYLPEHLPLHAAPRTMLHAWRLDIALPRNGEPWSFSASPPADFLACADALGLGDAVREALASIG